MTASKFSQVYEDVLLNRFLDSYTGGYRLAVFEHADSECISVWFGF